MSVNLPPQDLSSVVVGSTGTIELKAVNRAGTIPHRKYPTVVFLNESGVGLSVNFQGSNRQMVLPAGVWSKPIPVYNNDNSIDWTALYILPNSPVAILYTIFYDASEVPLEIAALGNSPIGISGNVATSNIQSLTNDGNPAPTQIIESTPSGQGTSSFNLNNDGSGLWQILSANTLKQIVNAVRGNTGTGKAAITIGDASDPTISTFYGSLLGGQPINVGIITGTKLTLNVNTTLANVNTIEITDSHAIADWILINDQAGDFTLWDQTHGRTLWLADGSGNLFFTGSAKVDVNGNFHVNTGAGQSYIIGSTKGANGANGMSIGHGINGTENDMEITSIGQLLTIVTDSQFYIKYNNYSDGVNDRFISTAAGTAMQFTMGTLLPEVRLSTNTPTTGAIITWGAFIIMGLKNSAGGGSAGFTDWVGTTDPGASAGEGDTWTKG
jgi:hypothetical protein